MPIRVVVIDDDADFVWLTRLSLQLEHDITVIWSAPQKAAHREELRLRSAR